MTTTDAPLARYQNGNCLVTIHSDGTKVREWPDGEEAVPAFPESADIKITGYCDNPVCRAHCHERSNPQGVHGRLLDQLPFFDGLPAGVELAIGGGNPLSHPELRDFLLALRFRGLIPNLTVNQWHLSEANVTRLWDWATMGWIFGLGVSFMPHVDPSLAEDLFVEVPNCVWHVIAGVHTLNQVRRLLDGSACRKVLVLGYKQYGAGMDYFQRRETGVEANLAQWRKGLRSLLQPGRTFSFDNLALDQLGVGDILTPQAWEEFYLGEDGTFTMYADLVRSEFARSSTSTHRTAIENRRMPEAFAEIRAQSLAKK